MDPINSDQAQNLSAADLERLTDGQIQALFPLAMNQAKLNLPARLAFEASAESLTILAMFLQQALSHPQAGPGNAAADLARSETQRIIEMLTLQHTSEPAMERVSAPILAEIFKRGWRRRDGIEIRGAAGPASPGGLRQFFRGLKPRG